MKEIVNRLHENRQIQLAKEILESNGYKVSKKSIREDYSEEGGLSGEYVADLLSDMSPDEDNAIILQGICQLLGVSPSRVQTWDDSMSYNPELEELLKDYRKQRNVEIPGAEEYFGGSASIGTVGGKKAVVTSDYGLNSIFVVR